MIKCLLGKILFLITVTSTGFVDQGSTQNRIDELDKWLSRKVSSAVPEEDTYMFLVMVNACGIFCNHNHKSYLLINVFWKYIRNKNRGISRTSITHGMVLLHTATFTTLIAFEVYPKRYSF